MRRAVQQHLLPRLTGGGSQKHLLKSHSASVLFTRQVIGHIIDWINDNSKAILALKNQISTQSDDPLKFLDFKYLCGISQRHSIIPFFGHYVNILLENKTNKLLKFLNFWFCIESLSCCLCVDHTGQEAPGSSWGLLGQLELCGVGVPSLVPRPELRPLPKIIVRCGFYLEY